MVNDKTVEPAGLPPSLEAPDLAVVPTREQLEKLVERLQLLAERRVGAPERLRLVRDFSRGIYAEARAAAHGDTFRASLADGVTRVELDGAVFARNAKIRRAHMSLRRSLETICTLGEDALLIDPLAPPAGDEEGEIIDVATSAYKARPGALWFQENYIERRLDKAMATFASVVRDHLVSAGTLFSDYEYARHTMRATERAKEELTKVTAGRDPQAEEGLADALERLDSDRKRWALRMASIRADMCEAMDMPPDTRIGPPQSSDHDEGGTRPELPTRDELYRIAMESQPDVLQVEAEAAAADLVSSFACEGLPKDDVIPADVADIDAYALKLSAARQVCLVARETSRIAQSRWHAVRNRTVIAISDAVHDYEDARARIKQYAGVAMPKVELAVADAITEYESGHVGAPSLIAAILQRKNIELERSAAFRDCATARLRVEGVIGTALPFKDTPPPVNTQSRRASTRSK